MSFPCDLRKFLSLAAVVAGILASCLAQLASAAERQDQVRPTVSFESYTVESVEWVILTDGRGHEIRIPVLKSRTIRVPDAKSKNLSVA